MEPIRILRAPREAFNKNRPISDLTRKQVEHFRHVEARLSVQGRAGLPQGAIETEGAAALYIAAITRVLRGRPVVAWRSEVKERAAKPRERTATARSQEGLALAAAAETMKGKTKPESRQATGTGSSAVKSKPRKSTKKGKR